MKKAFTLAEVLITLTIIGVIAALTIPNLMQKWSDHADVAKVKEAYSILSNAIKMAVAENGPIDEWPFSHVTFGDRIVPHLKTQNVCRNKNGCMNYGWTTEGEEIIDATNPQNSRPKYLNGKISDRYSFSRGGGAFQAILVNGMRISILSHWNGYCTEHKGLSVCGEIYVDINGIKKPNQFGADVFILDIGPNSLYPADYTTSFNCTSPTSYGMNCVPWIIKHNNMDYKYRDVSAEW